MTNTTMGFPSGVHTLVEIHLIFYGFPSGIHTLVEIHLIFHALWSKNQHWNVIALHSIHSFKFSSMSQYMIRHWDSDHWSPCSVTSLLETLNMFHVKNILNFLTWMCVDTEVPTLGSINFITYNDGSTGPCIATWHSSHLFNQSQKV